MNHKALKLLLFGICAGICGCGLPFDATYGPSTGVSGRISVNGFGALRTSFENAGYKTRDVRRLTNRTKESDVIVWTPTVLKSTRLKVTRWFEGWLSTGDKTLIYVVPDSGSEANYWVQAGQTAPPKQRMEYRRRAARKLNERLQWTINRRQSFTNGWFVVKPRAEIFGTGELSSQNWDLASQKTQGSSGSMLTEYIIEPYDPPAEDNANAAKPNAPTTNTGPTGPASTYTPFQTEEITSTKVDFESIVKTKSGETIVAAISCDHWNDSKIIVVAGGSLLTNFAFTQDVNVELADQLIAHCLASSPKQSGDLTSTTNQNIAGFLLSSYSPIPVSERKPGVPQASGMELLTAWPLSLVTIHAALLGFIVCMMLLPIFGRPRRVDRGSTSHFGDHLDAVAGLMSNARGEKYARERISEYMKRMKGETSGRWVLPDTPIAKSNPVAKVNVKQPSAANESSENKIEPVNRK